MQNVSIEQVGDELVIRIPNIGERQGLSNTGKTIQVASSGGNKKIVTPHGTIFVGVNAYVKPTPEELAKLSQADRDRYDALKGA